MGRLPMEKVPQKTYVSQVKMTSSQLIIQVWNSGKGIRWLADEVFHKWLILKVTDRMRSPGKTVYIIRRPPSIMLWYIPMFRDQADEEKPRKGWPDLQESICLKSQKRKVFRKRIGQLGQMLLRER